MSFKLIPPITPGRPIDKRITAEYLAARNLRGDAFIPGTDIDLVDAFNDSLTSVYALVSYAEPTLGPALQQQLVLSQQSLADSAQARDMLTAIAGGIPYANFAAFPAASTLSGKSAIALDTGGVYRSDGTTWGAPLGYVVPKSSVDALGVRVGAVEAGQSAGRFGYLNLAAMNADLAHPAGALATVTNDATPANNGDYIKLGASGTGSWQAASTSRIALLEASLSGLVMVTYTSPVYVAGIAIAAAIVDSADTAVLYFGLDGKTYFSADTRVAGLLTLLNGLAVTGNAAISGNLSAATATLTALTTNGISVPDSNPLFYGGQAVRQLIIDDAGQTALFIGPDATLFVNGLLRALSGLTVSGTLTADTLNIVNGLTLALATIGTLNTVADAQQLYLNGQKVAKSLVEDQPGTPLLAVLSDGSIYAPGGIGAPNLGTYPGITTDTDGMLRINGTLVRSKSALNFPGDSLTEGTGATTSATRMPDRVAALLGGRAFMNSGLGGNTSTGIAGRMSAIPARLTASLNIPASGGVTVSIDVPLLNGAGIRSLPVVIGGVAGTLSRDNSAGTPVNTFTRTATGSAVTVPARSIVTVTDTLSLSEYTTVIWAGRNDYSESNWTGTLTNIRALVENLRVGRKRFVILSVLTDSTGGTGTGQYTSITALNNSIRDAFPGNYIDVRSVLSAGTADDTVPASLRYDTVHLNDAGYEIVAQEVYKFLVWKGW
jgi:lysophospholipase L1-like esterase